jgi:DNA-binding IclR family transcriptional regulator
MLAELETLEPVGTTTGIISRALDYDRAKFYITLQGLMEREFAERDTCHPRTYRLGPTLRDEVA